LPVALLDAFCVAACLHAAVLDLPRAPVWWELAALLRLGFWGLFRPKELTNLRRRELRVPSPESLLATPVVVATILDAKNRAFMGRLQVRSVRDERAVAWTQWLASGKGPEEKLWRLSQASFARFIQTLSEYLGVGHLGITPASLRAGGATAMLESGVPVANIRFAGCWASEKSLACYLQEAEAAATVMAISTERAVWLKQLLQRYSLLCSPPVVSYRGLVAEWTRRTA
jgi:hypothetical protein